MKIKLLVLDFDGVVTDGRVLVGTLPPADKTFTPALTLASEPVYDHVGPGVAEVGVWCSRRDAHGINLLKEAGVEVWCLTTEGPPSIELAAFWCAKLGIPVYQTVEQKGHELIQLLQNHFEEIALSETAYLGDDVDDLQALMLVGWPMITRDCHGALMAFKAGREMHQGPGEDLEPQVSQTGRPGGYGAVRDACDMILRHNEKEG